MFIGQIKSDLANELQHIYKLALGIVLGVEPSCWCHLVAGVIPRWKGCLTYDMTFLK